MDDCLIHSPTLEQHLLDVAEVLEIFRRRQLFAKSSKCEFGRQELGFLGHRLSKEGVSMDPRKVQSIVEWATPTSCSEVRRFTGLANYYRRFVEGYSEVAAPLTALGSPTARFAWTPEAQASFDALKLALSSAPVLRTFDPARRAVLTTDASNVAVAAILTQPDDEGHQHPVAYESRKLTATERNYPAHVLELLAVVHALRAFRHYLLGSGAPRPAGCWSDFDLRTDNQAITWLKTNRHLNKMFVRWLDEIEDFRFDVTHLPGTRNPTDPLSRRGFADGDGPAASTGDTAVESQQELFSRLGRDAPASAMLDAVRAGRRVRWLDEVGVLTAPAGARWLDEVETELLSGRGCNAPAQAVLAAVRARWAATRREAAATFANVQGGDAIPPTPPRGGALSPPCHSMFVALEGAELLLGTGTTTAPSPPVPSDDFFLSPTFVQTLAAELAVDEVFGTHHARCGGGARQARGPARHARRQPRLRLRAEGRDVPGTLRSAVPPRAGRDRPSLYPRWCRAARAGATRVSRRPARGPFRTRQDGVAGATPRLLGGPGRRRRRVRAILPDVPAHQGRARRPTWAPTPPAVAIATRRDDRGGLDRRAANDGGWFRRDSEPRRPAVGQSARSSHACDGDGGGCGRDHSRHVSPLG